MTASASEPLLSIVAPVYNEESCLPRFHAQLSAVLRGLGLPHEILFIDDGSTDGSLEVIRGIQREDPSVSVAVLSRNFGHQVAITAGLALARGAAVLTLDADLQHPPELIPRFVEKWRAGAKVVHGVRENTEDASAAKKLTSGLFYRFINLISETPIRPNAADFRLLDRQAVDMLNAMTERHRFLRGMISWIGLPEAVVPFTAPPRAAGRSKYTWSKMLRLAANGVFSFSTKPLQVALWLGLAVLIVNAAYGCFVLYSALIGHAVITGWTSLILLILFLGSSQMILLGIMGEYLGRVYEESKSRPLYLLREVRQAPIGKA